MHEAGGVLLRLDDERLVGCRLAGAVAAVVAVQRPGDATSGDRCVLRVPVDERHREDHLLAAGVGDWVLVGRAMERERLLGGLRYKYRGHRRKTHDTTSAFSHGYSIFLEILVELY